MFNNELAQWLIPKITFFILKELNQLLVATFLCLAGDNCAAKPKQGVLHSTFASSPLFFFSKTFLIAKRCM